MSNQDGCCGGSCGCGDEEDTNFFVEMGDKTPSFTVPSYDSATKTIGEYTYKPGKWTVFYFYPADFSFTCPTEVGDMESAYQHLKKQGVDIFGVSTDSAFAHSVWHRVEPVISGITFPLLADTRRIMSDMYNLYNPVNGFSRRATVILNPEGEMMALEIVHNSLGRSTEELIRKVEALMYIEKNGGVCAVNWKPGQDTMDPSKLIVGDITKK